MFSDQVRNFICQDRPTNDPAWTAVSLFSGAGLSDLGYEMAGFGFVIQVEIDRRRAAIGRDNFPGSEWLALNVRNSHAEIAEAYLGNTEKPLDLLVATPPCQGMSSSNPGRGKRQSPQAKSLEEKNRLLMEVVPIVQKLTPRIVVIENVRQILTLEVEYDGVKGPAVKLLQDHLPDYKLISSVINVADYGVAQVRKRALIVAVQKDEPCLELMLAEDQIPVPSPTHSEKSTERVPTWVSIKDWLGLINYQHLDAASSETARGDHPLHFVPTYGVDRYRQISEIPACSGRSAYENDTCPSCERKGVDIGLIRCPDCGAVMCNRPYVERDGAPSLIKGFKSSYRRMNPKRPSYTITTNSSHVGSDYKIHPWENRVLSILECADLQTVPRFFDWSRAQADKTTYLIRNLVGEALPPYFTYLHGQLLSQFAVVFQWQSA